MAKKKKSAKKKKKRSSIDESGGEENDGMGDSVASAAKVFVEPSKSVNPDDMFDFEMLVSDVPYNEQGDEKWNAEKTLAQRRALLQDVRLAECTHRWWRTFPTVPVPDWKPKKYSSASMDGNGSVGGSEKNADGKAEDEDEDEDEDKENEEKEEVPQCILRDNYISVYLKMAKALYKHTFNEGICRGYALMDWRKDTATKKTDADTQKADNDRPLQEQDLEDAEDYAEYMTNEQLHASLFELADMWTDSVDINDYEDFLDKLFYRITALKEESDFDDAGRVEDRGEGAGGETRLDGDTTVEGTAKTRAFKDLQDVTAFEDGEIGSTSKTASGRRDSQRSITTEDGKVLGQTHTHNIDDLLGDVTLSDEEEEEEDVSDLAHDVVLRLKKPPLVTDVGEEGSSERKEFEKSLPSDIAEALECDPSRIVLRKIWIGRIRDGEAADGEWQHKRHFCRIRILPSDDPDDDTLKPQELVNRLLEQWGEEFSELYDGMTSCGIEPGKKPRVRARKEGDASSDDEEYAENEEGVDTDMEDGEEGEVGRDAGVGTRDAKRRGGHAAMQDAERQAQELLSGGNSQGEGRRRSRRRGALDTVPEDGGPTRPAPRRRKRPKRKYKKLPPPKEWKPRVIPPKEAVKMEGMSSIIDKMNELKDTKKLMEVDLKDMLFSFSYAFSQPAEEEEKREIWINEACKKAMWMTRKYPVTRKIPAPPAKEEVVLERDGVHAEDEKPNWTDYCVGIIRYMFKEQQISAEQKDVLIRITNPHLLKNQTERKGRKILLALLRQFAMNQGLIAMDDDPDPELEAEMEKELDKEANKTLEKLAGKVSRVIDTKETTLTPEIKAKFDAMFAPPPSPPRESKAQEAEKTDLKSIQPHGILGAPPVRVSNEVRNALQNSLSKGLKGAFWPRHVPIVSKYSRAQNALVAKENEEKNLGANDPGDEGNEGKYKGGDNQEGLLPPLYSAQKMRISVTKRKPPSEKLPIASSMTFSYKGVDLVEGGGIDFHSHLGGDSRPLHERGGSAPLYHRRYFGKNSRKKPSRQQRQKQQYRLKIETAAASQGKSAQGSARSQNSVADAPWRIFDADSAASSARGTVAETPKSSLIKDSNSSTVRFSPVHSRESKLPLRTPSHVTKVSVKNKLQQNSQKEEVKFPPLERNFTR